MEESKIELLRQQTDKSIEAIFNKLSESVANEVKPGARPSDIVRHAEKLCQTVYNNRDMLLRKIVDDSYKIGSASTHGRIKGIYVANKRTYPDDPVYVENGIWDMVKQAGKKLGGFLYKLPQAIQHVFTRRNRPVTMPASARDLKPTTDTQQQPADTGGAPKANLPFDSNNTPQPEQQPTERPIQDNEVSQIKKDLKDAISSGIPSAKTEAQDTITEATAEGRLDAMEDAGIDYVTAIIETVHDNRRCKECEKLDGRMLPIEQARGLLPVHPNCFAEKTTKVFTDSGWKWIDDVTTDDKCWSEDPETGECSFVAVKNTIKQHYSGDYVVLKHKWLHQEHTADHNCYIYIRSDPYNRKKKTYKVVRECDKPREYVTPIVSRKVQTTHIESKDINGYVVLFDTYVKLMAYFLSDGSCTKRSDNSYCIKIAESDAGRRLQIIEELSELKKYVNLCNGKNCIYVCDSRIGEFLHRYGKTYDKWIPTDILQSDAHDLFLSIYAKTDGHTHTSMWNEKNLHSKQTSYFTTSENMVNGLTQLLINAGRGFSIAKTKPTTTVKKDGEVITGRYPCYRIREKRSNGVFSTHIHKHVTNYDGMVCCVELEKNHTVFVWQNNSCYWSGNCRCSWRIPKNIKASQALRKAEEEQLKRVRVLRGRLTRRYNAKQRQGSVQNESHHEHPQYGDEFFAVQNVQNPYYVSLPVTATQKYYLVTKPIPCKRGSGRQLVVFNNATIPVKIQKDGKTPTLLPGTLIRVDNSGSKKRLGQITVLYDGVGDQYRKVWHKAMKTKESCVPLIPRSIDEYPYRLSATPDRSVEVILNNERQGYISIRGKKTDRAYFDDLLDDTIKLGLKIF